MKMFRDKKGIKESSDNLVSNSVKLATGGAADWDFIRTKIKPDPLTSTALPRHVFLRFANSVAPRLPCLFHTLGSAWTPAAHS